MANRNRPEEDPAEGSRATVERELDRTGRSADHGNNGKEPAEQDAGGQFARTEKGHKNKGVASADPRVLSGKKSGDATWPLKQDKDHG
jgi:hypothetical protein